MLRALRLRVSTRIRGLAHEWGTEREQQIERLQYLQCRIDAEIGIAMGQPVWAEEDLTPDSVIARAVG